MALAFGILIMKGELEAFSVRKEMRLKRGQEERGGCRVGRLWRGSATLKRDYNFIRIRHIFLSNC